MKEDIYESFCCVWSPIKPANVAVSNFCWQQKTQEKVLQWFNKASYIEFIYTEVLQIMIIIKKYLEYKTFDIYFEDTGSW